MNYLIKNPGNHQKLSLDLNTKPKSNKLIFSSMVLRANLINLSKNSDSPPPLSKLKESRKIFLINNYSNANTNENFYLNEEKSKLNLTSIRINHESNIINKYYTKAFATSSNMFKNANLKHNLIKNNIKKFNNNSFIEIKRNRIDTTPQEQSSKTKVINTNKELGKRFKHKQVKREIYIDNNNQSNKQGNYKKINNMRNTSKKLIEKQINSKSITISMNEKIKSNFFDKPKKTKPIMNCFFLKSKYSKKIIKNNIIEDSKENNENIALSDNKTLIDSPRNKINCKVKRIKSPQNDKNINLNHKKNNSITKYRNSGKILEKKYYHDNSKGKIENNDMLFNENELNENMLSMENIKSVDNKNSDTMINKVLLFKAECNGIFNPFNNNKTNMSITDGNSNLDKDQSRKIIEEKKESSSTIISSSNNNNNNDIAINIEENEYIKNMKNILQNNLDYNLNRTRKILRKKPEVIYTQKLKKYNTDNDLVCGFYTNNMIYLNKHKNKEETNIYEEYYSNENTKNSSLTTNKEYRPRAKLYKSINLNMPTKKIKILMHNKKKFYEILSCNNFIQIFFSFCEVDIHLLNKFSLISKETYKIIKPFIYGKISKIIFKYNDNIEKKNTIKKYLMKNYSSLIKLSPALLRKKYTDLVLESNKFDNDIKKDLTRTFPDNILFKYGNNYYNKLYHILTAYSNFNKNIGYIQGLNFLAAHILYFFEDEIEEFAFLEGLIDKLDLDKILDNNTNKTFFEKQLQNVNTLIKKQMPKLDKFLSNIKINLEFFSTSWILTLFSDSMNNEFISIIWDYMIIFGWKFFKYFILNILLICETDILNSTQNNLTYIKKNMLRNEKFKINFHKIINDTIRMIVDDDKIN